MVTRTQKLRIGVKSCKPCQQIANRLSTIALAESRLGFRLESVIDEHVRNRGRKQLCPPGADIRGGKAVQADIRRRQAGSVTGNQT